ncbi:MAG TPA: hypothetical protein VEA16_15605 [Vicinamibacterales bacterium]|nr:hypothetical protein [Vicinamibacterales bacterium]
MMTRPTLPLLLGAAAVLAGALIASPLLVCAAIATPFCLSWCGRGLPPAERRFLIATLSAGLLVRVALVAAQFIEGLPWHNDMTVGALAGDESYYLSRALRVRDLMAGYAATKYDYFVANDDYGQTSYLTLLTWLQVVFGPTPYSLKVVNGLLYVCGAALLFRMARTAFGVLPSFIGLMILLFLPSLLFSSVSLLKESLYFCVSAVFITASWWVVRQVHRRDWPRLVQLGTLSAVSLLILDGLRRGALVLMAGGLLLGLVLWAAGLSRARIVVGAAVAALAIAAIVVVPPVHDRFMRGVETAAKMHAGHVFTVGHVYKLMDEHFYVTPHAPAAWDLRLTGAQAMRFLGRGAISFFVTPWPWQMRSTGELALLPEHMLWYVLVAMLPFGIAAGWRLDPLATALLLGFAIPTAAVVALTNGNVGTLFRLRGLATPYLLWISSVGLCFVAERLIAMRDARAIAIETA